MPSHLSCIGFNVESEEQFMEIAEAAAHSANPIKTRKGTYLQWCSDSGVELWLQVNKDNELIGMNPHFNGAGVARVGLTARIDRPDDTELDGAYHGWAEPEDDEPESGTYPFVFDCPDAICSVGLSLPAIVDVQIAAFAHEIELYESDEAYDSSQEGEPKFAAESFVPSGLFSPNGESAEPPAALAIFTGHILEAEELMNSMTKLSFWWAKVRTLGGVFDVVADPGIVVSPFVVGGVLSGSFWLSGRIGGKETAGGGNFLRRLFGRK